MCNIMIKATLQNQLKITNTNDTERRNLYYIVQKNPTFYYLFVNIGVGLEVNLPEFQFIRHQRLKI